MMKNKKFFSKKRVLFLLVALVGFGATFLYFDIYREKQLAFDLHGVGDHKDTLKTWTPFTPKSRNFSIYFPKKPMEKTVNLSIPGSRDVLVYREFYLEHENNHRFSISYATLPERWIKWGHPLVLKGAFKLIIKNLGKVSVVGKSSNTFKTYPSLDYEHYAHENETAGTLILVKNVLYKVEMTYPLAKRGEAQEALIPFIQSFHPETTSLPSSPEEVTETAASDKTAEEKKILPAKEPDQQQPSLTTEKPTAEKSVAEEVVTTAPHSN